MVSDEPMGVRATALRVSPMQGQFLTPQIRDRLKTD